MHNNFLVERSGKMSKSSGEFLRLQLLIDRGYHPLAYRLMCLQAHYRSELEFSWEGLQAALVRLKRLVAGFARFPEDRAGEWPHGYSNFSNAAEAFDAAISDDLNTPLALISFEMLTNSLKSNFMAAQRDHVLSMDTVLGLKIGAIARSDLRIRPKAATITEPEIDAILAQRREARAAKDFVTSDRRRDELAGHGVEVMDGDPLGWDWKLA